MGMRADLVKLGEAVRVVVGVVAVHLKRIVVGLFMFIGVNL